MVDGGQEVLDELNDGCYGNLFLFYVTQSESRPNTSPVISVTILSFARYEKRDVRLFSSDGARDKMAIHSPYTEITGSIFSRLSVLVIVHIQLTSAITNTHGTKLFVRYNECSLYPILLKTKKNYTFSE